MHVPLLCPVCGAYWKCRHQVDANPERMPTEAPPEVTAMANAAISAATGPVRGIITIDGVLLEDA